MLHPKPRTSEFLWLKSPEDVSGRCISARFGCEDSYFAVSNRLEKKRYNYLKKLKGMWKFESICWTTMETKTLKWWKFQDLGQLGESSSRCQHGIFFGAKSLTKKNEGQQNHMAVFSSFCLAKQLNRDRFTVSKFSDMTISSFLNRSVSGFLASTVPIRAAVTKNRGWEVARNWREVVCIRGTSNCRDFSLLDEFPVKRSLS